MYIHTIQKEKPFHVFNAKRWPETRSAIRYSRPGCCHYHITMKKLIILSKSGNKASRSESDRIKSYGAGREKNERQRVVGGGAEASYANTDHDHRVGRI